MEPIKEKVTEKSREKLAWLMAQSQEIKLSLLQNHLSLCQIMVNEFFEEEVIEKAGKRYSHNKPNGSRYSRWGYNPGSVQIGDQRLKVDVPRIRDSEGNTFEKLEGYGQVKRIEAPSDQLIKGVLLGLSMRDYDGVIDHLGEGFGLSKSSISREFKARAEERLKEFELRDLSHHDFVGMFIDGKYLAKEQIMIVLGVTMQGEKIPLGFLQAHSENAGPISDLFRDLIKRGLKFEQGLLFVVDGSKGIRKAISEIFGNKAVVQRCTWHKRENVKKYLKESDQKWFESEYHSALDRANYKDSKAALHQLANELENINLSASRSLQEGMEEILSLHKLGVNNKLSRSFKTTNVIENLNSQLEKYLRKVKYWKNSKMRYRWIASGLMEIEAKMRKISNYKRLPDLRNAIKDYIKEPSQKPVKISTKFGT